MWLTMYLQDTTEEQGYVARVCYRDQDTDEFEQMWTEALALASRWDFLKQKNRKLRCYFLPRLLWVCSGSKKKKS